MADENPEPERAEEAQAEAPAPVRAAAQAPVASEQPKRKRRTYPAGDRAAEEQRLARISDQANHRATFGPDGDVRDEGYRAEWHSPEKRWEAARDWALSQGLPEDRLPPRPSGDAPVPPAIPREQPSLAELNRTYREQSRAAAAERKRRREEDPRYALDEARREAKTIVLKARAEAARIMAEAVNRVAAERAAWEAKRDAVAEV